MHKYNIIIIIQLRKIHLYRILVSYYYFDNKIFPGNNRKQKAFTFVILLYKHKIVEDLAVSTRYCSFMLFLIYINMQLEFVKMENKSDSKNVIK